MPVLEEEGYVTCGLDASHLHRRSRRLTALATAAAPIPTAAAARLTALAAAANSDRA